MTTDHRIMFYGYKWSGSIYSTTENTWTFEFGNTLPAGECGTLDVRVPLPSEITKSIELPWRVSNLGNQTNGSNQRGDRRFGKAKWRKKTKIEYTFTGECFGAARKKMEWMACTWSKIKIEWYRDGNHNQTDMDHYWMECPYPEISYAFSSHEPLYVVVTAIDFTQTSKQDWFKYTMKLTRVDKRGFSNETTPGS